MGFGDTIRAARETKGWSQRELAEAVTALGYKITQTGIDKIEKRNTARPKCYPELVEVLGLSNSRDNVGKAIFNRRARLGLSQEELANRLGTNKSTVSRWESGDARLPAERLESIAAALGTSASDLVAPVEQQMKVDVGKAIFDRRSSLGISQAELASRLGISEAAVNRWENGSRRVRINLFPEIAAALKTTVAQLAGTGSESNAIATSAPEDTIDPLLLAAWERLDRKARRQLVQFALIMAGEMEG